LSKKKVGILGATGIVGQRFVTLLGDHPYFEITALSASKKSSGKTYGKVVDWCLTSKMPSSVSELEIKPTTVKAIKSTGVDIVFSALPSQIAKEIEYSLAQEGIKVFTNAGAHRMEKNVPILIPEINSEHINMIAHQQSFENGGFIITNSNCSTSGLVFGLKPLLDFDIESVIVSTYQALSGAGRKGVGGVDIIGNIIPFVKNEEGKMETETNKILGIFQPKKGLNNKSINIVANCARVAVKNGHLESITLKTRNEITIEKAKKAFTTFSSNLPIEQLPSAPLKPIIVHDEEDRPQPALDLYQTNDIHKKGMTVSIGRIRKKGNYLNFYLLVDNTMRGAAGASVLNAEYARIMNFL
jgi:aspartate-semialdehyde dehydrogenase